MRSNLESDADLAIGTGPRYYPNKSSSAKKYDDLTFRYGYGGFSASGVVYSDIMALGNNNAFKNVSVSAINRWDSGTPFG